MIRRRRIFVSLLLLTLTPGAVRAVDPSATTLSDRIDSAISESHLGATAVIANDYEFLRRVYLNLIGRTPTAAETTAFLTESAEDKRNAAIDQLLASEEFNDYFASVLDVMFMERRAGRRVEQAQWKSFLRSAVEENWSYDRIVTAMLTSDGTGEMRGAAKFVLDREVEPNALTRDIGRLFFGRDLQCAQCHDHPNITDYLQSEYYGIYAFVNRSYLFEDKADNNKAYVGEKADGETEFKSVFLPDDDASKTIPTLLDGLSLEVEPKFAGEDPYVVTPSKTNAGVPKFSRRAQLSRLITHPSNDLFAKNAVNRFWAHMMGKGFVEPVDFHHLDNPPSHPALLKLLADAFVQMDFDIRELLRQIARSRTYQRSIDFPPIGDVTSDSLTAQIQTLTAEIEGLTDAKPPIPVALLEQLTKRRQRLADQDTAIAEAAKQFDELQSQLTSQQKKQQALHKQVQARQSQLSVLKAAASAAQEVVKSFPEDTQLANPHATYQQRVDATAKQLDATQKQLAEQDKLIEQANANIAKSRTELARLNSGRMGIADMVAESRGALLAAQSQQTAHAARRANRHQQLAALEKHQVYLDKLQTHQHLAQRVVELAEATEEARQQTAIVKTKIVETSDQIDEQNRDLATLRQTAADHQKRLAEHQKASQALREASEQAQLAADALADPDLEATATMLDEKQRALEQLLTATSEQSNSIDTVVLATEKQIASLEVARRVLEQQMAALNRQTQALSEATARRDAAAKESQSAADGLRASWERRFAVRTLVPLSPEQLAGSTISALELRPSFERAAEAEWKNKNKDKKPEDIDQADQAKQIAASIQKRVDDVVNTYVSMFAAPAGAPQDVFSATADQALFLANDGRVQSWLNAAEGTLLWRLQNIEDANELADKLYMAVLTRPATEDEKQELASYLTEREKDRKQALREFAWGLFSSLEFRFNR